MSRHIDGERWKKINAVLDEVLDLEGAEREEALRRSCAGDDRLRADVERLLAADARAAGVVDESADAIAAALASSPDEEAPSDADLPPGTLIGAYRIHEKIGQGGMGRVYLAERADGAFEQRVALKLMNGLAQAEVMRQRFLLERQILARLTHAGIARLVDGGTTEDDRPYLVMEFVDGRPITDHADAERLGIEERIRVFLRVCEPVDYAHRHLVVHRDIKPSNVLVTPSGDVKLLDFGVAKLLETSGDAGATLTRIGGNVMTPEYAAPEQVRDEAITTATDVYTLGVLLYELLSGRRPHHAPSGSRHDLERAIVDTEPPSLADAVSDASTHDATAVPASTRGLDTARLRRALRGDLSNIVAHALRKRPEDRYPSVAAFADDLRRYLDGYPVTARAPSFAYRARKYVGRHRTQLAAITVAVLALVAGLVGTSWQAHRASQQAERATLVKDFLVDLLSGADPDAAPGVGLTARQLLDAGAAEIDATLADDPSVQAEMLLLVGKLYETLGHFDTAEPLLLRALALSRKQHGESSPEVTEALSALGALDVQADRHAQADSILGVALERSRTTYGDRSPRVARVLNDLGLARRALEDYEGAEALLREAVAIDTEQYGPQNREVATDLNNLALLLTDLGRYDESDSLHHEVLAIRRAIYPNGHSSVYASMQNIAETARERGDYEAADSLFRATIEAKRAFYGEAHPSIAVSLNSRGLLLSQLGRLDEADSVLVEALEMNRRFVAGPHESIGLSLNNLGILAFQRGDVRTSRDRFEQAYEIYAQLLEPGHRTLLTIGSSLATLERVLGDLEAAEARYRELLAAFTATAGERHPERPLYLNNLGAVLRETGRASEAVPLHREALDIAVETRGENHLDATSSRLFLANALLETGELDESLQLARRAEAEYVAALDPGHHRIMEARCVLGRIRIARGEGQTVLPMLESQWMTTRESSGASSARTADIQAALGECLVATGARPRGDSLLAYAERMLADELGDDHYRTRKIAALRQRLAAHPRD